MLRTLQQWARSRGVPAWLARRVYDVALPNGIRAGAYRMVREEDEPALDRALHQRAATPGEVSHAS
jgi:hypothetical protein